MRRRSPPRRPSSAAPVALAAAAVAAALAPAAALAEDSCDPPEVRVLRARAPLRTPVRADPAAAPMVLLARTLTIRPDIDARAEGDVELQRGNLLLRTDALSYDVAQDRAVARGHVRIEREGAIYTGPELDLKVQRFEGFFLEPTFEFTQIGAGGRAARVDFLGAGRSRALDARYTSCPREGPDEPAWLLKADRVDIDLERNEGVADGAVLRFLGTPIIALPTLSFPLGDTRKSGWLPPTLNIDNRSGVDLSVPYYWNIAPNRDATLAPRLITRRGFGLDGEFRYLEERFQGDLNVGVLPDDRVAQRSRGSLRWQHESRLPWGLQAHADLARVSDDDWWRDFPDRSLSLLPRLLPGRLSVERAFAVEGGEGLAYARWLHWQPLQAVDSPLASPYQRSPQVGLGINGRPHGWEVQAQLEYNRFTLPDDPLARAGRSPGERVHVLARLAHPYRQPGWWVVPQLAVNAAAYGGVRLNLGPSQRVVRTIPTFSLDAGLELERTTTAFGRALRQTLEPRLQYVQTPFREQSHLPNYDAAAKDFNFASIYSPNVFSGVDRVSDANQVTAGVTTRLVDEVSGVEALRLGLVQRVLLRDQRVAPKADGSADGPPLTQRFSDVLLLGSTGVLPNWNLDASLQYSPEIQRPVRSIIGVRYSPGPFRTVATTYRFARGLSEQVEVGWQWPLLARAMRERGATGACQGALYTVGRVNYSLKDSRVTDSILGLEYDAGCWIGRLVAERRSTGLSASTTRLLIQLELVGLSRIGSNPLKVLKDNIPGYRLLRDDVGRAPDDAAGP